MLFYIIVIRSAGGKDADQYRAVNYKKYLLYLVIIVINVAFTSISCIYGLWLLRMLGSSGNAVTGTCSG